MYHTPDLSHKKEHSVFVGDHCAEFCHLFTFYLNTDLYMGNILWQKITSQLTKLFRIMGAMWFIVQNIDGRKGYFGSQSLGQYPSRQRDLLKSVCPTSLSSGYQALTARQCSSNRHGQTSVNTSV